MMMMMMMMIYTLTCCNENNWYTKMNKLIFLYSIGEKKKVKSFYRNIAVVPKFYSVLQAGGPLKNLKVGLMKIQVSRSDIHTRHLEAEI